MKNSTTPVVEREGEDRAIPNPDDPIRREALQRTIGARLLLCNVDELRVLDQVLVRLEIGRHRYGHLDLAKSRDWDKEEAEELLDARIYRACQVLVDREGTNG